MPDDDDGTEVPALETQLRSALEESVGAAVIGMLSGQPPSDPSANFKVQVSEEDLQAVLSLLYEGNPPEAIEEWLRSELTPEEFEAKLESKEIEGARYYRVRR